MSLMEARWPVEGLTGDLVALRRWRDGDADGFVALFDAEVRRWNPPVSPLGEAELRGRVAASAAQGDDVLPDRMAVVSATDEHEVLGGIDWRFSGPVPPFSCVDIGYHVGPHARGRGVGTQALRLLSDWLLRPDGGQLHRVQLDHAVDNVGSCRVATGAGFAIEGRRPQFLPLAPEPGATVVLHDVCLHGRVRR